MPHTLTTHHRSLLLPTACLALLIISACSPRNSPPTPAGPEVTPAEAGVTPAAGETTTSATPTPETAGSDPASTPAEKVTIEREVDFGSGEFNLPDPMVGLGDLPGYEAVVTTTFDGTKDGQALKSSTTYTLRYIKEPLARQLTIDETQDGTQLSPVWIAEMNGTSYEVRSPNPCSVSEIQPSATLAELYAPASMLAPLIGAEKAGSETLNGAEAEHYTFDQRALGEAGLTQTSGEVWVSAQDGVVLKYQLTRQANPDYFSAGTQGTETITYQLNLASQPAGVEIPADCPAGMLTLPLLPDAANVDQSLGMLYYESAASLADATAFYQEQIQALGWTPDGDASMDETEALLDYRQGSQVMTVIISNQDGGGITIDILVSPAGE